MSREELLKGISILGGRARLKVSKDLMEAYIQMDGEPDIDLLRELKGVLEQYGISHGVLGFPRYEGDRWIVAQGAPPKHGQDGTILVYPFPEQEAQDLPGVCRDERAKSVIVNVEKGQIVARKTPPTEGTPGINIFGEEIPPIPGKWAVFKIGEGVESCVDQRELMALWTGKLDVADDGTISVLKEWIISGNLDFSIGNVEFWGERLVIRGSIMVGMEVRARGDLEVDENIEDEVRVEVGGNLQVKGIIRAKMTKVLVHKDLQCNAVEYATLNVRGDVEVEDYMLDARCEIGGHLVVIAEKGLVAGGIIMVGRSVAVRVVGSPSFTRTKILAGFDPVLKKEFEQLVKELEGIAQQISKVEEGLSKVFKLEERRGGLGSKGKELKEGLIDALGQLKRELSARQKRLEELEKMIGQLQSSQIQVLERVYPNSQISIYNALYEVPEVLESVLFRFEKGRVVVNPIKAG